jgi:quercetin dioxygenase-like cupin family protein
LLYSIGLRVATFKNSFSLPMFIPMHRRVSVRILEKTEQYEITIETIESGGEIFRHYHPDVESEIILSGVLHCNGKLVKPGSAKSWKPNDVHGYQNKSDKPTKILSIYYGKWTEDKEILVK